MHPFTDGLDGKYMAICPLQMPEELNSNLSTPKSQQPLQSPDLPPYMFPPCCEVLRTPPTAKNRTKAKGHPTHSSPQNLWWQLQLVAFECTLATVFIQYL